MSIYLHLGLKILDYVISEKKEIKRSIESCRIKRIRRKYYDKLDSAAFVKWRNFQLYKIYHNDNYFTKVGRITYPAFTIPFEKYYDHAAMEQVISREDFNEEKIWKQGIKADDGKVVFPKIKEVEILQNGKLSERIRKKRLYRQYRRILKQSIKYPQLVGFSLDHYDMSSGKITKIHSKLGTYEYNVFTSHILEFELYKAYKKLRKKNNISIKKLWKHLPFRHYIHFEEGTKDAGEEVLFKGMRRYSLFGVQCLVLLKVPKTKDEYQVLLMKRSDNPQNVVARPGYYQFLPSGGFELFEKQTTRSLNKIKYNYSLKNALFREYMEEVFNLKSFQSVPSEYHGESVEKILLNIHTKKIVNMIERGNAHLNLLGVTVDLVGLRHEISFVLKIDDEQYAQNIFIANEEFANDDNENTMRKSLAEVESLLNDDNTNFNPASALLYKMYKDSPFYPLREQNKNSQETL